MSKERTVFMKTRYLEQFGEEEDKCNAANEVRGLNDYRRDLSVFGDMLDSNQKAIDPFSTGGRHKKSHNYYLSRSCFKLLKRTIRKNSNKKTLFGETLKDVENNQRDLAGYLIWDLMKFHIFVEKHGRKKGNYL